MPSFSASSSEANPASATASVTIASATAKGLGLSWGCPSVSVPTVAALAFNLWGSDSLICPIMDARRGQVYTGLYLFETNGDFKVVKAQCAVDFSEIAEDINANGQPVTFLGDGVPVFKDKIAEIIKVPYRFAPAHLNRQHASSVAALGSIYYANGDCEIAADHRPEYLRLSQAERERMELEKSQMPEKEGKA